MARLSDYLDPDADQLADRVDFVGMFGDFGRATVVAFFSALTGVILSIQRGFLDIFNSFETSFRLVYVEYASAVPDAMVAATDTAVGGLSGYGLLSGPVGILVLAATLVGVVFVFRLFWGDGL